MTSPWSQVLVGHRGASTRPPNPAELSLHPAGSRSATTPHPARSLCSPFLTPEGTSQIRGSARSTSNSVRRGAGNVAGMLTKPHP